MFKLLLGALSLENPLIDLMITVMFIKMNFGASGEDVLITLIST